MIVITENKLNLDDAYNFIKTPKAGACLVFLGTVRDNANEKNVKALNYEAYAGMAKKKLEEIEKQAIKDCKLENAYIAHAIGTLEPGEISLIIAVSSAHRDEAYKASRFIIEEIKKDVPIWKQEVYEDSSAWIH